jgi:DNA damage-binding protein 1
VIVFLSSTKFIYPFLSTRVEHSTYRGFFSEKRVEPAVGFVDGDLIETVVEMPKELLENIVEGLKMKRSGAEQDAQPVKPEDVLNLVVEDLAQLH